MRTKRRKVSARGLAGVVLVLACGVAEGAFMEFGGPPVDYVKIRLWKEDGELKSEFRGVETEFGEIAGVFRGLAGRGATELALHWLVDGDVTVRELSAKVGALAALGFTNQFFLANGETTAQHLEFDLADFAVWDGEELEDGEEKGLLEGAEESFSGDGPVELTIAEDVSSCTWTVKDFEEQERRQEEEAVRWNADVKVEGDEVRLTLSRDGDRGGKTE